MMKPPGLRWKFDFQNLRFRGKSLERISVRCFTWNESVGTIQTKVEMYFIHLKCMCGACLLKGGNINLQRGLARKPVSKFSKRRLDRLAADQERDFRDLPVWREYVRIFGLRRARANQ
jgi:deoxyribodipyrimidine photolyase-like uncharacterized protein